MHTQLNTGEHFIGPGFPGNSMNKLPNFLSIFHFSFFMEHLEAVVWVFPGDDAQTNTTFCAVDCLSVFWAKPAPSLVCESWEVIHLIIADINHGSWGCWLLYASGVAVHILLPSFRWPPLLLSTGKKGICNLQPGCLELFVLLHTNAFGILTIQQPSIVDGTTGGTLQGCGTKPPSCQQGQLLPCGHCTVT